MDSTRTVQVRINDPKTPITYPIHIGKNIISQISLLAKVKNYSRVVVLTESSVAFHWLKPVLKALPDATEYLILPAGEAAKSLVYAEEIWNFFRKQQLDRRALVINLGGGALCDLGGFAASAYLRGIAFAHLPTTLLAQVDACIGGKVAIDFAGIKNLIGAFASPTAVIIDTKLLQTLPQKEFISGYAEIAKHALLGDPTLVSQLLETGVLAADDLRLQEILYRSCNFKRGIVESDFMERGPRKVLNFGHTIGHALEALSIKNQTPLLHGEAISLGMLAEAKIALEERWCNKQDFDLIEALLEKLELPVKLPLPISNNEVLELIAFDKKNSFERVRWTLLKKPGDPMYDIEVKPESIIKGLEYISA